MDIRFALLGPLRTWRGDTELALGTKQQRLVLALLLARAGEWVSLSDLVELLWGERPPSSAVNIVQRYVGALRRLLEPGLARRGEGQWLLGEAGSYQMRVSAESLDLLAFRRDVAQSRRAAAAGRTGEALDLMVAALTGWRDRCAAGLDDALSGHPAFVALENECTDTAREAAHLALRVGQPATVLPALRRSAARNPYDEALQAQVMLVLAADGKQTEAIRLYQHVRQLLDDQLGVRAGPDLQAALQTVLHSADLEDVSSMTSGAGTPGGPAPAHDELAAEHDAWVPPAQLPTDHPYFAGRDRALDDLLRHIRSHAAAVPVLGVDGIPGVGKTTLAVHLAHLVAHDFPDGQLYADLRGFDGHRPPTDPGDALQDFLSALGVVQTPGTGDVESRAALYRSALAGRRVLIVLDNAGDADQVRPLLPGDQNCLVIVTSRTRLATLSASTGAHLLTLDTPDVAEARDSFVNRIGAERAGAEAVALDEIIERCGRLPLAMALVAARAADQPLATIVAELRSARRSLEAFDDENLDNDLRAIFSWSYRRLTPAAARLFRLLALHPGPDITAGSVAALAGVRGDEARTQIAELIRTRLITPHRPHRYRVHVLMRTYATELATASDSPADQAAALRRLHDFYQQAAHTANALIESSGPQAATGRPGIDAATAASLGGAAPMEWFIAEHAVLRAVVQDAAARGETVTAWRLALSMQVFYHRYSWLHEWRDVAQIALDAVTGTDDTEGRARMERSLAGAQFFLGQHDEALTHLRTAMRLFERAGMDPERAQVLMNLSRVLLADGNYPEAIRHHREAMLLLRKHGLRRAEASALQVMANYLVTQRPRAADALTRRAAELAADLGDVRSLAICDELLARCALTQGRISDARRHSTRGIERLRDTRNRITQAEALTTSGDIAAATGDWDAARDAWQEALSYFDDPRLHHASGLNTRLRRFVAEQSADPA